jgi:cell fate (sporulation/competence/biofilm development) regulator YlbF (YheA/YmcA/DUF963 family)
MEDLIAHARELGRMIAAHPRCRDFLTAARAVAEDRGAQGVLRSYQEQLRRIQELEAAGKPIEVDDKHKLMDLQGKVAANEKLKTMMKHQANYLEMMNRVNQAIDEAAQSSDSSGQPQA